MYCYAQNWTCNQVFEGHSHYVMQVQHLAPGQLRCKMRVTSKGLLMDAAQVVFTQGHITFASASLDRTVKVGLVYAHQAGHAWSLQGSNDITHMTL